MFKYSFKVILVISTVFISNAVFAFNTCDTMPSAEGVYINFEFDNNFKNDTLNISVNQLEYIPGSQLVTVKEQLINGKASFKIPIREAVILSMSYSLTKKDKEITYLPAEPGDSLYIRKNSMHVVFTGTGAAKKRLYDTIQIAKNSISKPAGNQYVAKSLADFLSWNVYRNQQLQSLAPVFTLYQDSISSNFLNYLKFMATARIEEDRKDKFISLYANADSFGISGKDLCNIYDSCIDNEYKKWMNTIPFYHGSYASCAKLQLSRKHNFDSRDSSLTNFGKVLELLYSEVINSFTGIVREKVLIKILTSWYLHEYGFTDETEAALVRYYKDSRFPVCKAYVEDYVSDLRSRRLNKGFVSPDFTIYDQKGNAVTKESIKGKVTLMDFWFTGCAGCLEMTKALKVVEDSFRNNPNVIFLSISKDQDKNKWETTLRQKKYTLESSLNTYTGGKGDTQSIIYRYNIKGYPTLHLLDHKGRIVLNPVPNPRRDNGRFLIQQMKSKLAIINDGPYILRDGDKLNSFYINGYSVTKEPVNEQANSILCRTDIYGVTFNARLKEIEAIEADEYSAPEKLFVVSDIEGEFAALRKLLFANKVIDENFNWSFGRGHLVLLGDMFDRGEQVTETLWLIYSLEEKAKQAGGYVHYILGNHEIMNLNGDLRYVNDKYLANSSLLNKSIHADLYGKNSVLGQWLRKKNIVEKIGDLLFVHGGISPELNKLELSITEINNLARQFYDRDSAAKKSENKAVSLIYNTKLSPFWYRNYYLSDDEDSPNQSGRSHTSPRPSAQAIEGILKQFGVSKVVTGHTVYKNGKFSGQNISTHYNGAVINIDTYHARGFSEGLLIEGGRFFRGDLSGKKFHLYDQRSDIAEK